MTSDEADRCGPPSHVWRNSWMKSIRFECRPIDRNPPEKTLGFMYREDGGVLHRNGIMLFQDGAWQKAKGCPKPKAEPTHWVVLVDE